MKLERINKSELMSMTKKDIVKESIKDVHSLLDEGMSSPEEALIVVKRMKDYLDTYEKELKHNISLTESVEMFGAKLSMVNGRKMVQYQEDAEYNRLNELLKHRKELIDLAMKSNQDVIDSDGAIVPKVSIKYASNSINIKY